MHKPKKSKCSVVGLVAAGLVSVLFGLSQILRPVPYVSMGGTGKSINTNVMSFFAGDEARFTGVLILFMGMFLLTAAYRIKKPYVRERRKEPRPEPENDTLSDTTGTPWENDQDHTTRQ
jgi:hypothetical protein